MFYGADSSVRYVPLHFGKPTFVLSHHCSKPHDIRNIHPAQLIRWLLFRNRTLPSNCSAERIYDITRNIINNPAYILFPEFASGLDNIIQDFYNL